jgi:hypothetical protein
MQAAGAWCNIWLAEGSAAAGSAMWSAVLGSCLLRRTMAIVNRTISSWQWMLCLDCPGLTSAF